MTNVFQAHRERVGRRIRLARVTAGLSHDQLGQKVGTSRQHLIKLEKGIHLARPEMLAKIAEATGKSVAYLEAASDDEEEDQVADLVEALMRAVDRRVDDRLEKHDPAAHLTASTAGSQRQGG